MKLTSQELENTGAWEKAGIRLPAFDRAKVIAHTREHPVWVHFGAGNIFRSFPAAIHQTLLEQGLAESGIIVAEGYDYEIIDKLYLPHDNLGLLVTLKADGSIEKSVIASVVEALKADTADKDFERLREIFRSPDLQMISFTITEKGYDLKKPDGSWLPDVEADFSAGPAKPVSYIGKLAALMYERFGAGSLPVALVSMDNCSHNGDRLFEAVNAFASRWSESGLADKGFAAYIANPALVSFPWSMIDKITPRPDDSVKAMLEQSGFDDATGIVTAKNTYVAPFVNAEEAQYLVIEDAFPAKRPPLEKVGVLFADRETVDKVEKMKVCTCLNPLHTALAIFGSMLRSRRIFEEMHDPELKKLVEKLGYDEGLPVVVNPGIIDPKKFLDEVLHIRLPNPFMPDAPQRIATDTSLKMPIRIGETLKAWLAMGSRDVCELVAVALVIAGWCRYLTGLDDAGTPFEISPDPMLDTLTPHFAGFRLGPCEDAHARLKPILSDERFFGVDLYAAGLGAHVEALFREMSSGPGAVRATLKKHLA